MSGTAGPRHAAPAPGPRRALSAILVAVAAALLVWVVATLLLDLVLEVQQGDQTIRVGALAVVLASAVSGFVGWAVSVLLGRLAALRAPLVWVVLAVAVTLLSLLGPLTSGAARSTVVVLVLMHLVVAAVLVPGLRPGGSSPVRSGDS